MQGDAGGLLVGSIGVVAVLGTIIAVRPWQSDPSDPSIDIEVVEGATDTQSAEVAVRSDADAIVGVESDYSAQQVFVPGDGVEHIIRVPIPIGTTSPVTVRAAAAPEGPSAPPPTINADDVTQTVTVDVDQTGATGDATLHGTVRDAETTAFIEGARVVVGPWESTTAGDGSFSLGQLPAGVGVVQISAEGYGTIAEAVDFTDVTERTIDVDLQPVPTGTVVTPDDGGEVPGPNGVTLDVPPGAVAEPVSISIQAVTAASPETIDTLGVPLFDILPPGVRFDTPAQLRIDTGDTIAQGDTVPLRIGDPATLGFRTIEGTADAGGVAVFELSRIDGDTGWLPTTSAVRRTVDESTLDRQAWTSATDQTQPVGDACSGDLTLNGVAFHQSEIDIEYPLVDWFFSLGDFVERATVDEPVVLKPVRGDLSNGDHGELWAQLTLRTAINETRAVGWGVNQPIRVETITWMTSAEGDARVTGDASCEDEIQPFPVPPVCAPQVPGCVLGSDGVTYFDSDFVDVGNAIYVGDNDTACRLTYGEEWRFEGNWCTRSADP